MGQDKKQLTKLLAFVKELYDHPDNKEFAAGIQALVLNDLQLDGPKENWTKQINEIYELCLKKNLREQAEDLYKVFPITEIADDLASLYVEMEDARRHNDFDAFSFNLYQQIELIVNSLIKDTKITKLYDTVKRMMPFTIYDRSSQTRVRTQDKQYQTAESFILIPKNEADGTKTYKSAGKPLYGLTALEKARAVIYMVNNQCDIISSYKTLSFIYNVRNHDAHSGGIISDYQKRQYEQLIANMTQNYLLFLSFLLFFLDGISHNYPIAYSF